MAVWRFFDYRTAALPSRNLIQLWYGEQDRDVQAEFDATVKILEATEDWRDTKAFKELTRQHAGLGEIRFSVRKRIRGREIVRRFRPVGLWIEGARQFTFLVGCEKSRGMYTPPNAFDLALRYKADLENGIGDICEHY